MIEWFVGLLTPDQWDAWRGWLTTIGGLIALSIGVNTYRRNVTNKREEQARLVFCRVSRAHTRPANESFSFMLDGATEASLHSDVSFQPTPYRDMDGGPMGYSPIDTFQVNIAVHNGSKELIGPARVQVVDRRNDRADEMVSVIIPVVEPESDHIVEFIVPNRDGSSYPKLGPTVLFRDASGEWWRRHMAEPIERVHSDPENAMVTPAQRHSQNEARRQSGKPPLEEPKVKMRHRWHRFWRRMRGKSALP